MIPDQASSYLPFLEQARAPLLHPLLDRFILRYVPSEFREDFCPGRTIVLMEQQRPHFIVLAEAVNLLAEVGILRGGSAIRCGFDRIWAAGGRRHDSLTLHSANRCLTAPIIRCDA